MIILARPDATVAMELPTVHEETSHRPPMEPAVRPSKSVSNDLCEALGQASTFSGSTGASAPSSPRIENLVPRAAGGFLGVDRAPV